MSIFGHQRREEPFVELAFFCPSCNHALEEIEDGAYKGFFCPQCLRHFFKQPEKRLRKQMECDRTKRKDDCVRKEKSFFIQDRQKSAAKGKAIVVGLILIGLLSIAAAAAVEFMN